MEGSIGTVSVRSKDEDIRKILEEKREARKMKLMKRLGRNHSNPLTLASMEALTGTLKSKKPSTNVDLVTGQSEDATPVEATKPKDTVKKSNIKSSLSFRQTATSLKRANIASLGVQLKRSQSLKSVTAQEKPVVVKKDVEKKMPAPQPRIQKLTKLTVPQSPKFSASSSQSRSTPAPQPRLQKLTKLTVPQSPKFSARSQSRSTTRPPVASSLKPPVPTTARQVPQARTTQPPAVRPKTTISVATGDQVDAQPVITTKRKSSTWMIPLSPDRAVPPTPVQGFSSPRTPIVVKPYIRKSLSDSKAPRNASPKPLARSVSSVALARASSSSVLRKSVAPTPNRSMLSRSSIHIQKEPSQQEKVKEWLEKRGRSIASCRHVSCLGHQLKDFPTPERKPATVGRISVRKSVKIQEKPVEIHASPQLKRNSSLLNTTFEKEDEEEVIAVPPTPFQDEAAALPEDYNPQSVEEFHTPDEDQTDATPLAQPLTGSKMDQVLETIAALIKVQEPVPETDIEKWICKAEASFPAVRTSALYWDIKARMEERRGNTMEALDIYNEGIDYKAEPIDMMSHFFTEFQLRVGANLPTGQRTPLLRSLGVDTPLIHRSRRSPRRPLIDASQAFESTVIKYELQLKQMFHSAEKENREGNRRSIKTPMKFSYGSSVSVQSDVPYELVATPVRRSMRPKQNSRLTMPKVNEQMLCVDDLDELSPVTRARAVLRKNAALE